MRTIEEEVPLVTTAQRAAVLLDEHRHRIYVQTDRLFALLMVCQWLGGIGVAWWISPRTWVGTASQTHVHVWAAVVLGGVLNLFPAALAVTQPGTVLTRQMIAIGQSLTSALLIHLTGGRIETHFHVFGSLAFLAVYRDWRVLITATGVIAGDHFLRGVFWPQSVFGVLTASPWRWVEHAAWVIFEDIMLLYSCRQSNQEMQNIAEQRASLEAEISDRHHIETQLRQQAREVIHGVLALTEAANAISTSVTQVVTASTETATAVTHTVTTIAEVKQTAAAATGRSRAIAEASQQTVQVSRNGETAVENALGGMQRLQEQMELIVQSVVSLSEQNQTIGTIITTVTDVADQSNLLAINAAIEAAKAGDHGKGFGVVAQEVKHLADQSKQATTQVRTILQNIQTATTTTVHLTEQGTHAAEVGARQALEAGAAIRTLALNITEAAQSVTQIAVANTQQLGGVDQVEAAMESIKQATSQNLRDLREIERAVQHLLQVGQRLRALTATSNGSAEVAGHPTL